MIFDLALNYCFIHIPRTGGKLITQLLIPHLTVHGFLGGGVLRHIPARDVPRATSLNQDIYTNLWKFTIYRPISQVKESMGRLMEWNLSRFDEKNRNVCPIWKSLLIIARTDGFHKAIDTMWDYNKWPHSEEEWRKYWICDENNHPIIDTIYEYSPHNFGWIIRDIFSRIKEEAVV